MDESPQPDRIPITIEVSPDQKQRIEQLAERKGLSPEAIVRAAIDHELETTSPNGNEEDVQSGSFLDGIEHLVGSVDGPSDLSSNPDHMEEYGRS
jgi:predicted transcriptional regulator